MKNAATTKKTVDAQTKQYAKEQARLEKEQAQLEKEKQRQKDEHLKEEQKKQCIDAKIAKEQFDMMTKTKTLQRIGVIVLRSDIERHINGIEHEDLWMAIGERVTKDSVVKDTIMSAVKDDAAKWREINKQDARGSPFSSKRQVAIRYRMNGRS